MIRKNVVLITGASSGIGRAIADRLAGSGWTVFGTSRLPARHEPPRGWDLIELDVGSDESVSRGVRRVLEKKGRLDALINNAGVGLGGAAEEAAIGQVEAEFETNFFGLVRMTKAALPTLRAQRGGTIVNMSSGNAAIRLPFASYYTASKCAIEGFSACLRREVRPFGIRVSVIEPAFVKTNLAVTDQMGRDRIDAYEPSRTEWTEAMRRGVSRGFPPGRVARCVERILASRHPRFLYVVDPGLRFARWLKPLLPEGFFYWGIRKALRARSR